MSKIYPQQPLNMEGRRMKHIQLGLARNVEKKKVNRDKGKEREEESEIYKREIS